MKDMDFLKVFENYKAKGSIKVDYLEDEGSLQIEKFEISKGEDLGVYVTENKDIKKSGYWTFGPDGNLYVSSGNTDQVLRYSDDGVFEDIFVAANSGGLDGPKDLKFGPDGNLYVSSGNTDQVLRYSDDGVFEDIFVAANSGGLDGPKDLKFGPDGNLYVSSDDRILRFDGESGIFLNDFVTKGSGGLNLPTGLTFGPDGNLYVSSGNTDQVLRYSDDGVFEDIFVAANSGGLDGPKDLKFGPDGKYLYVTSFFH